LIQRAFHQALDQTKPSILPSEFNSEELMILKEVSSVVETEPIDQSLEFNTLTYT